jgi:hypothetical protein
MSGLRATPSRQKARFVAYFRKNDLLKIENVKQLAKNLVFTRFFNSQEVYDFRVLQQPLMGGDDCRGDAPPGLSPRLT